MSQDRQLLSLHKGDVSSVHADTAALASSLNVTCDVRLQNTSMSSWQGHDTLGDDSSCTVTHTCHE